MIKLEKRDIEYIAERRYNKATFKRFLALMLGGLVAMIATAIATRGAGAGVQIAAMVFIIAGILYGLYRYFKAQTAYVEDFVEKAQITPIFKYEYEDRSEELNRE